MGGSAAPSETTRARVRAREDASARVASADARNANPEEGIRGRSRRTYRSPPRGRRSAFVVHHLSVRVRRGFQRGVLISNPVALRR